MLEHLNTCACLVHGCDYSFCRASEQKWQFRLCHCFPLNCSKYLQKWLIMRVFQPSSPRLDTVLMFVSLPSPTSQNSSDQVLKTIYHQQLKTVYPNCPSTALLQIKNLCTVLDMSTGPTASDCLCFLCIKPACTVHRAGHWQSMLLAVYNMLIAHRTVHTVCWGREEGREGGREGGASIKYLYFVPECSKQNLFFWVQAIKTGHISMIYLQTSDILLVSSTCKGTAAAKWLMKISR